MEKDALIRSALLKQLIKSIGSNRIHGFTVKKVECGSPAESEIEDMLGGPEGEEEDIEELLAEARAARAAKKAKVKAKIED
jgi:hypothetical protein